jgi:thiamine monophosphate synthase
MEGLADTGIAGISVISAIFGQEDVEEATVKLKAKAYRTFRSAEAE